MPRYHVDTDYGGCTIRDIYGVTLADDAAAQRHALTMLANLARGHRSDRDANALRVLLRNEAGSVLYGATLWLQGSSTRAVSSGF